MRSRDLSCLYPTLFLALLGCQGDATLPASPAFKAHQDSFKPPRAFFEVDCSYYREEVFWRLPKAKVVWANYALLLHDFPRTLASLAGGKSPDVHDPAFRRAVDDWLIREFARISQTQAQGNAINDEVEVVRDAEGEVDERTGCRPESYGRAALFVAEIPDTREVEGLLDVKGLGVEEGVTPRQAWSGVLTLAGALRELAWQQAIEMTARRELAKRHSPGCERQDAPYESSTLESYAVIDSGFDVRLSGGERARAGMAIRRAQSRPEIESKYFCPEAHKEKTKLFLDLLLRYGLTTWWQNAQSAPTPSMRLSNWQTTSDCRTLDFGAFACLHPDEAGRTGAQEDALRFPFEVWGHTITGTGIVDHANEKAEEAVRLYETREEDRSALEAYVEAMLNSLQSRPAW